MTTFQNQEPAEMHARQVSKTKGSAHVKENPLRQPHPFAVTTAPVEPAYPLHVATYTKGTKTQ